ncbi:putative retrovirus polyprotein [Ceratocystis lukuohia]|uniref:Retrovirus polyprotein n=1 Tax=Ceratocystis lukuohia TaxID=2019550 RepID=A0ABR4MR30_9PEZI
MTQMLSLCAREKSSRTRIDDHVQKFEDLLSRAQGHDLGDMTARKSSGSDRAPTLHFATAAQVLFLEREEEEAWFSPAPQPRDPDAMDWECTSLAAQQGSPRRNAKWASVECKLRANHRLVFPNFPIPQSRTTHAGNVCPTELKVARLRKIWQHDLKVFTVSLQGINRTLGKMAKEIVPCSDEWKAKVPDWIRGNNVIVFDPQALYARCLPPSRPGMNYGINLAVLGFEVPWGPLYSLSHDELIVLRQVIPNLLNKKFIRISSSTAAVPIPFARKPGGGLRLCMDYWLLEKIVKKDRYPYQTSKKPSVRSAKHFVSRTSMS